jgi:hypothetical protein
VKGDDDLFVLLMAPVIAISSFLPGTFLGLSAVLAVAPTWFLHGPGERWIKFIGTRHIAVARLVCMAAAAGTLLFNAVPLAGIVIRLAVSR